jgi:IclR family pca regulon transcriptional regulator
VSSGKVGRSGFVQSLERGLRVIKAFSRESPSLPLSEVARRAGLTRATARRFLLTLQDLGYVAADGRLFSLRPRVLDLGYAYLSSLSLWEIAQPHMEALVEKVRESSSASVLDGTDVVYVVRVPTKRIMTVGLAVGSRLPAYATSMGRVLLAELPPKALDEFFEAASLAPLTRRTTVDALELRDILAEGRAKGWAMVDQELEDGLRSIAVPVRDPGGTAIAALNIATHIARVSIEKLTGEFLPLLRETARQITADLVRH